MNQARRRAFAIALSMAIIASSFGCAHDMQILNLHEYETRASIDRTIRITVMNGGGDFDERLLVDFVRDSLQRHPAVERVFLHGETPKNWSPDLIARIEPKTEYSGSGLNFLVTFPGFLVFTHAWNGFVYTASVETELILVTPTEVEIARRTLPTEFDLRHCGNERGMLASSGWWTPFWGAINLVIAGFMIQYDDAATQPFLERVRSGYGNYLANNIIQMVALALDEMPQDPEPATPALEPPLAKDPSAPLTTEQLPAISGEQEPATSP